MDHVVYFGDVGFGDIEVALIENMKFTASDIQSGKTFLILGYGVTGKAVAQFFEKRNCSYYVAEDAGPVTDSGKHFLGQVRDDQMPKDGVTAIIASPGISPQHAVCKWAAARNIPVVGELELASLFLKGEFLAVTGTNGKSTTVKLIEALLKNASLSVALKGNIGAPLITAVDEPPCDEYVIEESSYQTEQIQTMCHKVSVCLNVTDDHFDRYKDIHEYARAKAMIFKNSGANDFFIFNQDDAHCLKMSWECPAKAIPFSLVQKFDGDGAFVDGWTMVIRLKGQEWKFDLKACSLKGLHNQENMLASLLCALLIKSDDAAIASYKKTLASFKGLPHRVEKVFSQDGVDYYDDSKGTNVGSVVMALAGFESNVILIAGGKDKLGDYAPLKGLISGKVKKLILLGEAKERMSEAFAGLTDMSLAQDMREAVAIAKKSAQSGDTVLLSPACSSFDQYKNYHERGLDFQKWVKTL